MKFYVLSRTITFLIILMLNLFPSLPTRSESLNISPILVPSSLVNHLWVDALAGNDANNGTTPATAFRTIQRAANIAGPGTNVHILPGIYRETVQPMSSGSVSAPIVFHAENGPGTVIIRGSERSDTLTWYQLSSNTIGLPPNVAPSNLYYTDLTSWAMPAPPRFVVQPGNISTRLPLAREPDWQVITEWKYHEYWWAADGGSATADCDPASDPDHDCDFATRSTIELIDRTSDSVPNGIEPGNLTTLSNLVGATLVALDSVSGHYTYRREIIAHDGITGNITVDDPCEFDSGTGNPGLGWGSKYYVENLPALIDTPGEWWYDVNTARLYLWPPEIGNPATLNIEISRQNIGVVLNNLSYITLDGLSIEFFNENIIHQSQSCPGCGSNHNTIRNTAMRYTNIGIEVGQGTDYPQNVTNGFTVENSEVSHMDTLGIYMNYWWPGGTADTFTHAGIINSVIRNNIVYDLGFRAEGNNAIGLLFNHADQLRFEGNYIHHVAQNGMALSRSIVQSPNQWGFLPAEIKTGEILIKDNIFEKACLLNADCGALKIQGSPPDNHVFRDLLITGNIFRNTYGWTYISEQRERWSGGPSSDVQGMGGFGLYLDNASGAHVYRNIAYNNASSGFHLYNNWWDGDIVYYNNIAANSLNGIRLDGWAPHGSVNTQIFNNIVLNNEGYGILIYQTNIDYGNFSLEHNFYYNNGWRAYEEGGVWMPGAMAIFGRNVYYRSLAAIQLNTSWEDHGIEATPGFWQYDIADHLLFDGTWPDFHPAAESDNIIEHGSIALPVSLTALLEFFAITDFQTGSAYDIGRYEAGFLVINEPKSQGIEPGGNAYFTVSLFPIDTPYIIALSAVSPSPYLAINFSPGSISGSQSATITVADSHTGSLIPGEWYSINVTGTGNGFACTTSLDVLVGGCRILLPLFFR